MSKISAKRKARAITFYICLFVVIALVLMNLGPIKHGIFIVLNTIAGTI